MEPKAKDILPLIEERIALLSGIFHIVYNQNNNIYKNNSFINSFK
jgi:hypothetical protein